MAADAGELERELVVGVELAPPALVAAQQRVGAGADDELVAGIIAAGGEDGVMHGGQDLALVGAGAGGVERGAVGQIGQPRRLAHAGKLGRRFAHPQARDEIGDVDQLPTGQRRLKPAAVVMREPLRVVLDPEPPPCPEIVEHPRKIPRGLGVGGVLPDADVGDVGRALRLPQVRRARQQRRAAVGADIEALEEAEAEGVVAGQPIITLGREQQRAVEPGVGQRGQQAGLARRHLVGGEMYRQRGLLRVTAACNLAGRSEAGNAA